MPHKALARLLTLFLLALCVLPARAQDNEPKVRLSVHPAKSTLRPGDQFPIAIVFDHAKGWHIHPNQPVVPKEWEDFTPIATEVIPAPTPNVRFAPIQWPATHIATVDYTGGGKPVPYQVYEGTAIAFIPVQIDPAAPEGPLTLSIHITYQACDDRQCLIPEDIDITVPLTISKTAPVAPIDPAIASLFASFDPASFAASAPTASTRTSVDFNIFGRSFSVDSAGILGLFALLALAALGGFLLNLTPCVLPVIPLKIMGLSHAAGNPKRALLLGLIMCAGVIAFWLAIGLAIASLAEFKAINQLFQKPAFSLGVGAFIAIMGIGMVGLFTIQLPSAIYAVDPRKDSVGGSFMFGIMTAVLSTPCTAPFMGTAAAWATKQASWITLLTFAAIGAGMALPYLILSLRPSLVAKVPRSGPASELVKQVMGILMLAVAAFFLGTGLDPLLRQPIDEPLRLHWWLVAALVLTASAWMIFRAFKIKLSTPTVAILSTLGLLLSTSAVAFAIKQNEKGPIPWIAYTPDRFAEHIAKGNVVVIDFTAEWCLNCKALEASVLNRAEVAALLNSQGVSPFKVDLTGKNTPGQEKLKSLNWVGIPLLAVFGPGLPEPLKFDTYTPDTIKQAIAKARKPQPK
jgi:thiol:disulfide interchange protein